MEATASNEWKSRHLFPACLMPLWWMPEVAAEMLHVAPPKHGNMATFSLPTPRSRALNGSKQHFMA